MTTRRQERIAEMLREELSLLISAELSDPHLDEAMVTVTDVTVSPDLHSARVYVEHTLPAAADGRVVHALHHAATFLRRALAENLNLRIVPELTFHTDRSNERGQRIDALLDAVAGEHAGPASEP